MKVYLSNDSRFPVAFDDSWGEPVYLHKSEVENNIEFEQFIKNIYQIREEYLKKIQKIS